MKQNIIFHIGPRKCGKSLYVEKELEICYKNNLYIGTLIPCDKYIEPIHNHQKRRNNSWTLYEISYSMNNDFTYINNFLQKGEIESLLIDGLTTWVSLISKNTYDLYLHADILVNNIIYLIEHYNICIRLIDVIPESFKNKHLKDICKQIHNTLLEKGNYYNLDIKIINWRI